MHTESLQLPHILVEAVKEKRAVLILGAGASKECRNSAGDTPPDGNQMRDQLASKYLGTRNEKRDLMTVSEMAIENGHGQPLVFDEIARMLDGFEPSEAHNLVTQFNWKGLATTNYDTLLERAYASTQSKLQSCVKFTKDAEPYDERLAEQPNPVPYLKLHGCLDYRLDPEIPLILSHEHYSQFDSNRRKLFQRLREWAETSVLVFVGYTLSDSHIRELVYKIDPSSRPQWFIVSPGADENDSRLWAKKSVEIISSRFGEFMDALDTSIEPLFRKLSTSANGDALPYQKHFRTQEKGSELLRATLQTEVSYIHSGLSFDEVSAENFYTGFDKGWCGIVRKYDFVRKAAERLLYDAVDLTDDDLEPKFYLLQGSAGAGKSVAMKRAAYDAATALEEMTFWVEDGATIRIEVFEELFELTGKRAILFVDQISLRSEAVHKLLRRARHCGLPITVIAAEREADWYTYCSALENEFPPTIFKLGSLSESESEDLVDLLQRHKCLGFLASKSKPDQIAAFMDPDRADRQLLVALHELTKGKPFEQIISDEYQQVSPEAARRLYLDIATMHQFGVVARAGVISRISGIRFDDFQKDFFHPLSDIVRVIEDRYTGDKGYSTRHSSVARLVFGAACATDDEKSSQLARVISGLDIGFSSDKRIIESTCKGRRLAEQFSDISYAREIFEMACEACPSSAFLYQQAAILEYSHSHGSLERAEELAQVARGIDDRNIIYIHTLAEIARRRANVAATRPMKEKLRNQSRGYLNEINFSNNRKDLTFCKLLIDEVADDLAALPAEPLDHQIVEFDAKVDDAVKRLETAKADNPDEPEFLSSEATLWQKLGESDKAYKSLEKAAQIRPRNSSVFTRLAKVSKKVDSSETALALLRQGLEKFPTDKSLHQAIALELLDQSDDVNTDVEYHLKSSFVAGDNNFDGRFYLAAFFFLVGKTPECSQLFTEIDEKAPASYRPQAAKFDDGITAKIQRRTGVVERRSERMFFIRIADYPSCVFAHISSLTGSNYDELAIGTEVSFDVRFNRKGPVAVNVQVT